MSTIKIPFAIMAFDTRYFSDVEQTIKWDGKKRNRNSLNQDQTPITFISQSALWVSRLIVNNLGQQKVQLYINKFDYGNRKISGDLNSFWLPNGSIKISAQEQVKFLSRVWLQEIELEKDTMDHVKKAILHR